MSNKMNQITDLVYQVARRAMTDEEFRAKALSDASGAIDEVNGSPVATNLEISFVESGEASRFQVALPPPIGGEFSEADLASIAGGKQNTSCTGTHRTTAPDPGTDPGTDTVISAG